MPTENHDLKKVDKYNVLGQLGEGASSVVYLVELDSRQFALKLLKTSDAATLARFRRESSTLARLNQDNLLKIFDIGEFEGGPYIVMELLKGNALGTEITNQKKIPEVPALKIMVSVLKALGELHKNSLLHRDIKPNNIFVTFEGVTKLIDLGLVGNIEQIKTENVFVGTPLYCSPEQNRVLKRPVDYRSDLYSVGVTFFETLCGRPPFLGTTTEILQQHAARVAPDIREIDPEVRPALALILNKALSKDPDDRYQSASGLLCDLERLDEIDTLVKSEQDPKLGIKDRITLTSKVKFVQRLEETEKISVAWKKAQSGHPSLAIVSGPSGSGKTRLTEEFLAQVKNEKMLVLRTKCQFFDRDLPFGPVREAIDGLLDEVEYLQSEPKDIFVKKIKEAGRGREEHIISLSKSMLKLFTDFKATKKLSNLDGDRELFFNRVSEFFVQLSEQFGSLVFFVDDLQWLDQSSRLLFQKILENAQNNKIFILGTARDDQESRKYVKAVEEALATFSITQVQVDIFSENQMSSLVNDYLGSKIVAKPIVGAIFSRSKGNAFVAIEYLRAGLEQGYLTFEDGEWQLNFESLAKIALSDNVYDLILKRIDSSSKTAKEFLQYAALYGNTFRIIEIASMVKLEKAELESILQICADQALIEPVTSVKWKFVHDKIPESLILALEPNRKKEMCDQLAHSVFAKSERSPEEVFVVARLFSVGHVERNLKPAIQSLAEAGDLAFSGYAYAEAHSYYKVAFDLIETHKVEESTRIKFAANLAISATMISEDDLALQCSDLYLASSKSDAERAHALVLKIWILNNQGKNVWAWEYFKKASKLIGQPYPLFLHWKILQIIWLWALTFFGEFTSMRLPRRWFFSAKDLDLNQISNMYRDALLACEVRGNNIDVILVSLKFLVIGQYVGGTKERALGYTAVGFTYANFGLQRLATFYFNKAKEYCDILNDPPVSAIYEMRTLLGYFYCGVTTDYVKEFNAKQSFLYKYLCPAEYGRVALNNGWILSFTGHHKEALDILLQIIELRGKKDIRIAPHTFVSVLNQAWAQMAILGQVQELSKIKEAALALNYEFKDAPSVIRSVFNAEISVTRVTEKTDANTDEILAGFWKRRSSKLSFPIENNVSALMTYVRLLQFQRASTVEEKFSTRLELKSMLRHLFLYLYCPLFRANYFFLRGSYFCSVKKYWLAEMYFRKAEIIASQAGGLRVLFDIQRDRARIYKEQGHLELMKMALLSAIGLANKYAWNGSLQLLKEEFPQTAELLPVHSAGLSGATHSSQSTHSEKTRQSRTQISRTHQGTTAGGGSSTMSRFSDRGDLEQARFTDALLAVSSAFTNSVDPIEQARSVLNQIIRLFAAERGFIFMKDEAGIDTSILAGMNSEGLDLTNLSGYSSTVVNRAINESKPLIITGTDEGEALGSESAVLHNLRSIMATPLIHNEKVLGAVYLDSSLTKGLFTQDDIELFSILANHISVAFELLRISRVEREKADLQNKLDIQSAIATESKKVRIMVDNMQQALFSIETDGVIVEPVSRYSEKVFAQPIENKNILDILFKDLKKEKLDTVRSTLTTVFGEDELQWSLMEDNFEKKISFSVPGKTAGLPEMRTLKIQPSPIWDDQEKLEKILFVVEDITSLETLEKQVNENRKQTLMMEDIITNDASDLRDFFSGAANTINLYRKKLPKIVGDDKASLVRDLHTLKGNARLYKLRQMSELVHNCETTLLGLSGADSSDEIYGQGVTEALLEIESLLQQYQQIFSKIRNSADGGGAVYSGFNSLAMAQLETVISNIDSPKDQKWAKALKLAVLRLSYKSVKDMASRFDEMVQDLAKQLNKKITFQVRGDALVSEMQFKALQDCFLHLIRNSIDHGLELPSERVQNNKVENGTIVVSCEDDMDRVTISITDDGKGIDENVILKKALEKKLVTQAEAAKFTSDEKINLIFMPNFSTKEVVTDVSGRGVGMDVVKDTILKIGGDLKVTTKIGQGSTFTISFRPNFGIAAQPSNTAAG